MRYFLIILLFAVETTSAQSIVNGVGAGEYNISYMTNDRRIRSVCWGGFVGVSRDTCIDMGIANARWIFGGQYESIYINNSGAAGVSTTDTVGIVFKDNANGGDTGRFKYPLDSLNNRFDSIQGAWGWFLTRWALRNGEAYYWGFDGQPASGGYGALHILGTGNGFNIARPFKLGQPGGGRKIIKLKFGDEDVKKVHALCDDGTVWVWTQGSGINPSQVAGITNAIDMGGIARAFTAIVTSDNKIKVWGQFTSYAGLADNITTPTDVTSTWTNQGLTFPIKQIACSFNVLPIIDANDTLFMTGDNAMGEIGNGDQINPWRTYDPPPPGGTIFPFAWSFDRGQKMVLTPFKHKAKIDTIFVSHNIAFYVYAKTILNDSLYFWGRRKAEVGGDGVEATNMDTYPCFRDLPAPKTVNPLNIKWNTNGGAAFNFNDSLAPEASAGFDRAVITASDSLYGQYSSQQEHGIASYSWSKISGPSCTIVNSAAANTAITGISTGTYVFELTVTNTDGQTDKDRVTLFATVSGGGGGSGLYYNRVKIPKGKKFKIVN